MFSKRQNIKMESTSNKPVLPVLKPTKLEEIMEIPEPDLEPFSTIINPFSKVLTLPRTQNVNQPLVVGSVPRMDEIKSQMSSRFWMNDVDSRVSRADYLADMAEEGSAQVLGEMFASNFRGLRNRNEFVQKIFFLLGVLMCTAFGPFLTLYYSETTREDLKKYQLSSIVFALLAFSVILSMLICARWIRQSWRSILALVISDISITILYGVLFLSVGRKEQSMLIFTTGCLMVIFIISSAIASQRKWEILSKNVMVVLVVFAIITCGLFAYCISKLNTLSENTEKTKKTEKTGNGEDVMWTLWLSAIVVLVVIFVLLILRNMVFIQDFKVYEHVYATLVVYLSVTTFYLLKTLFILSRTNCTDYERIAASSRMDRRRDF